MSWPLLISCSYSRYSQLTRHSLMLANGRIRQSLTALVIHSGTHWSLSTQWRRIQHEQQWESFWILWWNAPMFYYLWCQTNAALMRTSTNNPLFSSNCTTWLIHVHHTWSKENILAVLHIIPLDLQFCHIQRHVREHVNIFQCPLHVMDACQNCVTMDAMAGNQGTKQKCTN